MRLEVGPLLTNCYIIYWSSGDALLIDPGGDADKILSTVGRLNVKVRRIVLTHGHVDHIAALPEILEELNTPYMMHSGDTLFLEHASEIGRLFGINVRKIPLDRLLPLEEGREMMGFKILHTPGHSPGSITLYGYGIAFTGDTLFKDGVGRTDLPGGSDELLCRSLKRIMALPDETLVYPGHGEETSIRREKLHNEIAEIFMERC